MHDLRLGEGEQAGYAVLDPEPTGLRPAELDSRRKLGLIIHDAKAVKKLVDTFEADWVPAESKKQKDVAKESKSPEEAADVAQDKAERAEEKEQAQERRPET